jgi:hypothetical protein
VNRPEILHLIRHDLQRAVARQGKPPTPQPMDASPWVAMRALQKAIRLGREDLAPGSAGRRVSTSFLAIRSPSRTSNTKKVQLTAYHLACIFFCWNKEMARAHVRAIILSPFNELSRQGLGGPARGNREINEK